MALILKKQDGLAVPGWFTVLHQPLKVRADVAIINVNSIYQACWNVGILILIEVIVFDVPRQNI